jgi:hypothetical protein
MAAYESISYGAAAPFSYIFVRDEPHKITPLGRFFVFHEVGHASARNLDARVTALLGWKSFLLPVPLVVISLQYNLVSSIVVALYLIMLVIVYPIYKHLLQYAHFNEEVSADRFARRYLSYESRQALTKHLATVGQLPRDSSLRDPIGEDLNAERSKLLLHDLDEVDKISGASDPVEIEYMYSRPILYILSLFAVLIPIMGVFTHTPSVSLLCVNGVTLVITLGIATKLFETRSRLNEEIKSYLSETNQ